MIAHVLLFQNHYSFFSKDHFLTEIFSDLWEVLYAKNGSIIRFLISNYWLINSELIKRSACAELKVTQVKLGQFPQKTRENGRKLKKQQKNVFAFFSKLWFSKVHPSYFAFNYVFLKFFFTIR